MKYGFLSSLLFIVMYSILTGCSKSNSNNVTPTQTAFTGFACDGVQYSGYWSSISDVGAGGQLGYIDVGTKIANTNYYFTIYNIPAESSGVYTFLSANSPGVALGSQLYALCTLKTPAGAYDSTGGTITKTSAGSFTFSCTMLGSAGGTVTVTGQGNYQTQ